MPEVSLVSKIEIRNICYGFLLLLIHHVHYQGSANVLEENPCLHKPWYLFDCTGLGLNHVPKFQSDTKVIILSNNKIKVVNNSFVGLNNLNYLWVNKNGLETFYLSDISAISMSKLFFLDLSDNNLHIASFPTQFKIPSLIGLGLHHNVYDQYPETFISSMVSLQNLTIDVFDGFKFGNGFLPLRHLSQLDIYPRIGSTFDLNNDTFSGLNNSKIKNLYMNFTDFVPHVQIDVFSPFHHLESLTFRVELFLDIRHVLRALYGLRGRKMEYLNLAFNFRYKDTPVPLDKDDIQYLSTMCIKQLDISKNDISKIPFALSESRFAECLKVVIIGGNLFQGYNLFPVYLMMTYVNITSFGISHYINPPNTGNYSVSNGDIIPINKTLDVTFYLSDSLRFLNFSRSTSNNGDLLSFINFHIVGKELEIADLSYVDIPYCNKNFHFTTLTSIKNLNLTGSKCSNLNETFLSSMTTLEILTFQDSGLSEGLKNDPSGVFLKGLFNLVTLDLGNNNLQDLHDNLFNDQTSSLRNLYLQDNLLRHIPKAIQKVKRVEILDIQRNKLSVLSEIDTEILDSCQDAKLKLAGNPFECSCKNLDMIKWLENNKNRTEDFDDIKCIGELYVKNITGNLRQFELKCLGKFWLELSATLCILLIIFIIITAICYRYRVFIEYLYIILMPTRQKQQCVNEKYEYDVFISYSSKDYIWVINTLYKRLNEENVRVAIHDKDFIPGRDIANEILRCIDQSRKVIFVVTNNFLNSEWGNFELEMTRIHAFRSGRSGLIIILKDGLQPKDMPDLLKKIWWKVVCAKWPIIDDTDENFSGNFDSALEHIELFWQTLLKGIEDE